MPLATFVFVVGVFACLSLPGFLKEREEKAWLARYEERVQSSQPLIAEEVEKILADFESEKDNLALVAQEMKNSGIKYISSRFDSVYEIKAEQDGEWGYYENEEINQVFPELWDAISSWICHTERFVITESMFRFMCGTLTLFIIFTYLSAFCMGTMCRKTRRL